MATAMRTPVTAVTVALTGWLSMNAGGSLAAAQAPADEGRGSDLAAAQRAFYTGRYEEAAERALALQTSDPQDLAAYDVRASALLFLVKRAVDPQPDKDRALQQCGQ